MARNMVDIARQAITGSKYASLISWCQYFVGLMISAFLGRPAPGGYDSATHAYRNSVIKSRNPEDAEVGDVVYFDYPPYGHVGICAGPDLFVHASGNTRGMILDLGRGAKLSRISQYATSRPFLGVSEANGTRPRIEGVAPYILAAPTPSNGYTYKMVVGDGLTYQEPTGEWANRLLRGLVSWGLDPKWNSISDGVIGSNTRKAIQRSVRAYGYIGPIDGKLGKNTIKAIQRRAKAFGGYAYQIDGIPGINTWHGYAKSLGQ